MSLYAVKNDEGGYAFCEIGNPHWETGFGTLWTELNKPYAQRTADDIGGQVVPLIEAPAKVVVSEAEAEMLKKAKNTTVWRPASVIAKYAYEHERQADDEVLLEERLMRAYVNGWTVEKPKLWNVKVPHTDDSYFYKLDDDNCNAGTSFSVNLDHDRALFTLAEIGHYGLQDCEKVEVPR